MANNVSKSVCFAIFELIRFMWFDTTFSYPHKEILIPRLPCTKYNPHLHA